MTHEEYQKLIQSFALFKEFDQDMQEKMLMANDSDMQKYLKIFDQAHQTISSAKQQLEMDIESVKKTLDQNMKRVVTSKRKGDEAASNKKEAAESEKLLAEIDQM